MSESNVIQLAQPGVFTDCLTEILRSGARLLLTLTRTRGREAEIRIAVDKVRAAW